MHKITYDKLKSDGIKAFCKDDSIEALCPYYYRHFPEAVDMTHFLIIPSYTLNALNIFNIADHTVDIFFEYIRNGGELLPDMAWYGSYAPIEGWRIDRDWWFSWGKSFGQCGFTFEDTGKDRNFLIETARKAMQKYAKD